MFSSHRSLSLRQSLVFELDSSENHHDRHRHPQRTSPTTDTSHPLHLWSSQHSSYRQLFVQCIVLSIVVSAFLSITRGFIFRDSQRALWYSFRVVIPELCVVIPYSIIGSLIFNYASYFPASTPPSADEIKMSRSCNRLLSFLAYPRTLSNALALSLSISVAGNLLFLFYFFVVDYPGKLYMSTQGDVILYITGFTLETVVVPMFIYRFNPNTREKKRLPAADQAADATDERDDNLEIHTGYINNSSMANMRKPPFAYFLFSLHMLWLALNYVYLIPCFLDSTVYNDLYFRVFSVSLPLSIMIAAFFFDDCINSYIHRPTHPSPSPSPCTNSNRAFISLPWTILSMLILQQVYVTLPAAFGALLGSQRESIGTERSTSTGVKEASSVIAFYAIITFILYSMRMVGRRGLPRGSSLALLFACQLVEETYADLYFLSFSPFDWPFILVSLLQCGKTTLRDMDLFGEGVFWMTHQWKAFLRKRRTAIERGNGAAQLDAYAGGEVDIGRVISLNTQLADETDEAGMRVWMADFDRVILRHQNFLAEMIGKAVVVTILLVDIVFTASTASPFSPNFTPPICTASEAAVNKFWRPSCLDLCRDVNQTRFNTDYGPLYYPPCLHLSEHETGPIPDVLNFNLDRRLFLLAELLYLAALQILTHFALLYTLTSLQKRRDRAADRHREERDLGRPEEEKDQAADRGAAAVDVSIDLNTHWRYHSAFFLASILVGLASVVDIARATAYFGINW